MKIETLVNGNTTVVVANGTINQPVAQQFESDVSEILQNAFAEKLQVVIDLSFVDYMSSAGLRVLMVTAKSCKSHGTKIALCGLNECLTEIFEISRFNLVFSIFETQAQAIEFVQN